MMSIGRGNGAGRTPVAGRWKIMGLEHGAKPQSVGTPAAAALRPGRGVAALCGRDRDSCAEGPGPNHQDGQTGDFSRASG